MPEWDSTYDWLAMLMRLANDDITKLDEVSERSYIEALNILSYWKVRDEYNAEINERLANKNK